MASTRNTSEQAPRIKAWVAILLAWIAGDVDGAGYRLLYRLFTAHMSGNSVSAGLDLGGGRYLEAWEKGFLVPVYLAGVVAGATLAEAGIRRRMRSVLAVPFTLEAVLLAAFVLGAARLGAGNPGLAPGQAEYFVLGALLVLAMGVQNATLRHVSQEIAVRTTFVTGMLTNLAERIAAFCFWVYDRLRRRETWLRLRRVLRTAIRQEPLRNAGVFLGIWAGYMVGATFTGVWADAQTPFAVLPALAGIVVVIALDFRRPIERHGAESGGQKSQKAPSLPAAGAGRRRYGHR